MNIFDLTKVLNEVELTGLHEWLSSSQWYSGVPGGFVTNKPNRLVNAYGDGAGVDSNGDFSTKGWPQTYWTAKMNQSNATLETQTEPLPITLRKIIPSIRNLFQKVFPAAQLTDHTFNIAVCNYYTDPTMTICAHTDDNSWYPIEDKVGPVFASFTFYPHGEPTREDAFARFQIKEDGKWRQIKLPHNSVMIMPSNIEHRVQAHTKKLKPFFKPRINITLRSTFPLDVNPLMNAMATANHTRYYKLPRSIYIPTDINPDASRLILEYYNSILANYDRCSLIVVQCQSSVDRKIQKKTNTTAYSQLCTSMGLPKVKGATNIVSETLEMVVDTLTKT